MEQWRVVGERRLGDGGLVARVETDWTHLEAAAQKAESLRGSFAVALESRISDDPRVRHESGDGADLAQPATIPYSAGRVFGSGDAPGR